MGEVWKIISGIEKYEVSSFGRVRNRFNGKILDGSINNKGYKRYDLCVNGKRIVKSGHTLVANAFIEKTDGKPFVNHIDGDKTNNRVENLEWCTHKENMIHSVRVLGNQPVNKKRVICLETGMVYESALEAERKTGIHNALIIRCCRGQKKSAGKLHWKYADVA